MESSRWVEGCYETFAGFEKPDRSTSHPYCEECTEYDRLLSSVARRDLSIEHIGTLCWGPISFLTPEAMAYYMPRLLELAVSNADDTEGIPYFAQFIATVAGGPNDSRFSTFGEPQRKTVFDALVAIQTYLVDRVRRNCLEVELERAIATWRT